MKVAIFSLLWPKNNFSAACVRTFGFIHSQLKDNQQTIFISSAKKSKQNASDVKEYSNLSLFEADCNDFQKMDFLLSKQLPFTPDIAIFDTFVCEEKFSHYVHTKFPNCLKVLDLQDMHSLRHARQNIIKQGIIGEGIQHEQANEDDEEDGENQLYKRSVSPEQEKIMMKKVLQEGFSTASQTQEFNREMASILRSDVVITCSDYEYFRLKTQLNVHHAELITFFHETPSEIIEQKQIQFEKRKNFVWIGNQSHLPNADSLRYIINEVWPKIHERLPEAQLHIYGSNSRQEFSNLDSLNINIFSRGVMPSLERLRKYKVMLAPLRYGAGIKGKIVDSWLHNTPVVTSPIGAEGLYFDSTFESLYTQINPMEHTYKDMLAKLSNEEIKKQAEMEQFYVQKDINFEEQPQHLRFGGKFWNFCADDYVKSAVELYTNEEEWQRCVKEGHEICRKRMGFTRNNIVFLMKMNERLMQMREARKKNYLYNLTWSETLRSTQNFAKYINEKNRNKIVGKKH